MNGYLIFGLGFFAQFLFFIRNIAQWFKSEQAGEVISPVVYWQISLVGSVMMLTYGILRNDFAIVLGQFIVYSIYIRNLQLKNAWKRMHGIARVLAVFIPLFYIAWLTFGDSYNFSSIIKNKDVTPLLMIWGSAGQVIFTFRFVYQWIYSENRKESLLPMGFWVISVCGSIMNLIYGAFRLDPVLIAAHSMGMFIYLRNILIHLNKRSLFQRIDIPVVNKFIALISGKIK